jgi:hypothetical protein
MSDLIEQFGNNATKVRPKCDQRGFQLINDNSFKSSRDTIE